MYTTGTNSVHAAIPFSKANQTLTHDAQKTCFLFNDDYLAFPSLLPMSDAKKDI